MSDFDVYNPYGPFQVSQGKAYIKYNYVPFEVGTLELAQVITNKKKILTEELSQWCKLEHENNKRMNKDNLGADEC